MAKTFRIFLSSTFGDFQAEREALKAKVWPVLESRCREHGAAFEVVDLRWGVSEADGLSHDTLRICLDEVAACRLLSPRPNFVMLIGDRYGWRPLPAEIPVGEFETLLATVPNEEDRTLLQTWYKQDDNAVPPHYRLQPRDEVHRDYAVWGQVESRLTQLLRDAAKEAFRVAAEYAHTAGRKVALTLSDSFCVDRHRVDFLSLVKNDIDILFSNEDEIKSLYQVDSINEALHQLRSDCEFAAVTRNEHGSVVIDGEEVVIIDAEPVDSVVDATGAGDMYAAGFLYGFVRGKTIEQCGKIGSIVASEVITHMGPRPLVSLTSVVPKDLLSF